MSDANWREQERLSVSKIRHWSFVTELQVKLHWSLVTQGVED